MKNFQWIWKLHNFLFEQISIIAASVVRICVVEKYTKVLQFISALMQQSENRRVGFRVWVWVKENLFNVHIQFMFTKWQFMDNDLLHFSYEFFFFFFCFFAQMHLFHFNEIWTIHILYVVKYNHYDWLMWIFTNCLLILMAFTVNFIAVHVRSIKVSAKKEYFYHWNTLLRWENKMK